MNQEIPKSCGACCTKIVRLNVELGGRKILEDINLHLHCGQLTAVVGPNGAGKTTLLRAILGQVPCSGHIHFLDSGRQRRDRPTVGYVPQKMEFDATAPLSVLDLFAQALRRRPPWLGYDRDLADTVRQSLSEVEAEHLLKRKVGQLSGGELQRVMLALAITPIPDLLLLDEPVSGVDQSGIDVFYRMVSDLRESHHLSIILVSHDLHQTAKYADQVVFLNRRVIVQGQTARVLADPQLRQAFGYGPELLAAAASRPGVEIDSETCLACQLEAKR